MFIFSKFVLLFKITAVVLVVTVDDMVTGPNPVTVTPAGTVSGKVSVYVPASTITTEPDIAAASAAVIVVYAAPPEVANAELPDVFTRSVFDGSDRNVAFLVGNVNVLVPASVGVTAVEPVAFFKSRLEKLCDLRIIYSLC